MSAEETGVWSTRPSDATGDDREFFHRLEGVAELMEARAGRPRTELAAAIRAIIVEIQTSTAADDRLDAARALVAEAAELLRDGPHGRGYEGTAEGSIAGDDDRGFVEYSPFIGVMNPLSPPVRIAPQRLEIDGEERDVVVGDVTFTAPFEGPPGCLHGGFVAALFDEMLGFAQSLSGRSGMTGTLQVVYRTPTPLGEPVRAVAWVSGFEGRKIFAAGRLHVVDEASGGLGRLCAEASGIFIALRPDVFEALMQQRARSQPSNE